MTRRRTTGLVLVLVALWCTSTVGVATAPALASSNAVVLALLAPRAPFVASAATQLPLWVVLPAFVARLSLGDPVHYVLGRAHGASSLHRLATRAPGCSAALARAEALVRRVGLPMTGLVPTGTVMAVAGAARLSFRWSMVLNLLGTTLRVLVLCVAARAAPDVMRSFALLAALTFPVSALMAGLGSVGRRHRRRSAAAARTRHPTCARSAALQALAAASA